MIIIFYSYTNLKYANIVNYNSFFVSWLLFNYLSLIHPHFYGLLTSKCTYFAFKWRKNVNLWAVPNLQGVNVKFILKQVIYYFQGTPNRGSLICEIVSTKILILWQSDLWPKAFMNYFDIIEFISDKRIFLKIIIIKVLSKSESVKFSLIESVICLFTDSSVKKI